MGYQENVASLCSRNGLKFLFCKPTGELHQSLEILCELTPEQLKHIKQRNISHLQEEIRFKASLAELRPMPPIIVEQEGAILKLYGNLKIIEPFIDELFS